ncbi:MFS transporter [Nitratireductor basaltis]|uniref:NreB protein n=1 Tax=Nitratireductor basaltis TaxID=472175 RepID=A0A084UDX9_9HYPH|nr:MFS transporter [Nitratireductor basaltis]KFB11165.1 NreB protein [Nitratireductor basaltis]
MLAILRNRQFRRLFSAQLLSLGGIGLMTVGLALLAYDMSGGDAGIVLGTLLAIKMIAYVGFAPLASALFDRMPTRRLLVALDALRFGLVLFLPFVTAVWQLYVIIFLFQLCSAAFTPAFQSVIPDILPEEKDYTSALSLSRLAYDMESLLSPLVAGLLLGFVDNRMLFIGTAVGLLGSAGFVLVSGYRGSRDTGAATPFFQRLTRGFNIYVHTPRLVALFALGLAVSFVGAWVIVNTVLVAREMLGGTQQTYTLLLAAYGLGSMATAITMRSLIDRVGARNAMIGGAALLSIVPHTLLLQPGLAGAIVIWFALGCATALVLTPGGLLLKRSSHDKDRPALFAAQFSISHAGWLLTYPVAGYLGASLGLENSFAVMAGGAFAATLAAWFIWPRPDELERWHTHESFEHDHANPHDAEHDQTEEGSLPRRHRHKPVRHKHAFVIDEHHPNWNM